MDNFLIVSKQIGIIIIFVIAGIIAVKTKLLKKDALDSLAKIVMNITMPLTLFVGTVNKTTKEDILGSWPVLIIAFAIILGLFAIATGVARLLRLKGDHNYLFRAFTMFGNSVFIGLPLMTALFDSKGLLIVSLYSIVEQFLLWTLGVKLTTHIEEKKPTEGSAERVSFLKTAAEAMKKLATPTLFAIALSIVFVFCGIRIDGIELINTPFTKIGDMTTPLSMLYLGGFLCTLNFKLAISNWRYYISAAIKLLIFPVLMFTALMLLKIYTLFALDMELILAMSLMSGMPTATAMVMFAHVRGSDGEFTCGGLIVNTVLCLVTLPVLCLVFEQLTMLII